LTAGSDLAAATTTAPTVQASKRIIRGLVVILF
jgi:hypothetical protein